MRVAFRARLRIVLAVLFVVGFVILLRLYQVQILEGKDYALKADQQYLAQTSALFDRGAIYFTRKDGTRVSAATLATGYVVALNPSLITDPEAAYQAVAKVASSSIEHDAFIASASQKNTVYVEVAHHLPEAAGTALRGAKVAGVSVYRERWRTYPGGPLAAQAIGFVAYNNDNDLKGRTGLEATYDSVLARSDNALYQNFFAALFSNLGNALVDARQSHEGDLVTTIEPTVETRLVEDLGKVQTKYRSKETGGIIMDPATGAIIAIASSPNYDPNDVAGANPVALGDPLVERVHEFGSIMKPLTMAAGLDAGVITATTTYNDTGCFTVDTAKICNYDLKARGVVPMQEVLSQSLNLGASWIATRLGAERFRSYFSKLFSDKTGIDQPSEGRSLVSNLNSPRQVEYDNMSFGQGIAMTPVQMIRALGTLANGGAMVRPHLVSAIDLDSGIEKKLDWNGSTQVFSAESVRQVSQMLSVVVDTKLQKGKAKIPSMTVAAKTGTAQLTTPAGGYYSDRYFHSFFGYFPAYAPRYVILLYTNDPQGVEYASETLTDTFLDLTHFLIEYYDIPPDRALQNNEKPS